MKRVLAAVLTLALLTPSLACMMAFCPIRAAQAAVNSQGNTSDQGMPCHAAPVKQSLPPGPMLVLDCMGVDLFGAGDHVIVKAPFLSVMIAPFPAPAIVLPVMVRSLPAPWFSRGPPPDLRPSSTALFAATTRLLI